MINQFRTLLLNISGKLNPGFGYPGEEFVDPAFNQVKFTQGIQNAWYLIFGNSPDRALLNYRLKQILSIIHGGELSQFIYDLDPRVTYWPTSDNIWNNLTEGSSITKLGTTTADLYLLTSPGLLISSGQLYFNYQVSVQNPTEVIITQLSGSPILPPPSTITYTTTNGLSNVVILPNSNINIQFQPTVGSSWQISWLSQPSRSLIDLIIAVDYSVDTDMQNALFNSQVEPYKTFQNMWQSHPYPPYRLSGFMLALGYAINNLAAI